MTDEIPVTFYSLDPYAGFDAQIAEKVKTEGLKPPSRAFCDNIARLKSLLDLPADLAWFSFKNDHIVNMVLAVADAKSPEGTENHAPAFYTLLKHHSNQEMDIAQELVAKGPSAFEALVAETKSHFDNAIQAVFSSQIIGIWTAFEVLAGDLWIAAVDGNSSILATLSGKENRILKAVGQPVSGEDGEIDEANDTFVLLTSTKTIGLNHLHELSDGTFDLSKAMGRLHVKSERIKFSSLKGIRIAYSLAFPENYKGLKPASIDNALSAHALDRLALVRNMLIHSGGKADDEYVTDHSKIPGSPPLKKGDQIHLDIGIVTAIIEPVMKASLDLIKGIDKWMAATSEISDSRTRHA